MNIDKWKNKSKKAFSTLDPKEKEDRRTIRRHKSKLNKTLHTVDPTDLDEFDDLDLNTFEKI